MAFECKIAADSLAPCGARLTTFIVTYPRAIHSEIMTHRMLTKSSASSRAIPTEKLIQRVLDDPWIPDYIGANQKGMQPGEELSGESREEAVRLWLEARDNDVATARKLLALGVHKGVVNRRLEANMWITVIISGTEWDNFIGLRTHEHAEPHFQHIARMMRDARTASEPMILGAGRWHLPLVSSEDLLQAAAEQDQKIPVVERVEKMMRESTQKGQSADYGKAGGHLWETMIKISVGRCARVSYLNHEGKRDFQSDIDLHDRLMVQRPLHAAPAEHVAQAMDYPSWFDTDLRNQIQDEANGREFKSPGDYRDLYHRWIAAKSLRASVHELLPKLAYMLREMQSGNYLGMKQYRKTLADENIGGLMP